MDAAASDGLKLARKYDPDGIRTIGVLTKCDIVDKGSDLKKMLENNYIKLTLGYVAVKNRSKKNTMDGLSKSS